MGEVGEEVGGRDAQEYMDALKRTRVNLQSEKVDKAR